VIVAQCQMNNFQQYTRTSYIRKDENDVEFVPDKHPFYGDSSLKQQSTGRHVAPH
jgi:ribosomal protein L31